MRLAAATRAQGAAVTAIALDDEGFLVKSELWDRALAQQMADRYGLGPLGPTHWMIIDFVRDRYFRLGAMPPMRNTCRKLGVEPDAVKKSFGTCRSLWQIAGLPNPGGEALSYMG